MIEDLDLAIHEKLSVITGNDTQAEIIRLARRYLALRKNIVEFRHFDLLLDEEDESSIDAAADRLLEGGE